jgi:hypothetical protein
MSFPKRIAKWWDAIPVKGWLMTGIVTIIGGILVLTAPSGDSCSGTPLRHVYDPSRLHVVATCQVIQFQVVAWRLEHDGDVHVNGIVQGVPPNSWINAANVRGQHGLTVVEFVPEDPRPERFYVGEVLKLLCTKVRDFGHAGWYECHPVFKVISAGGTEFAPGDPKKLAPPTEE